MNNTTIDVLLANNKSKTTDANNKQQRGNVAHGGRTTHPKVMTDADDTQEHGGVVHGGRTTLPEITTDADNMQQSGGVAHGGHDGAAFEGSTTAALGTTCTDIFDQTGNTQEV